MSYQERYNKQLQGWLEGSPTHNSIDHECCPDFSCCHPELLAPVEIRRLFVNAKQKNDDKTTHRLLGEFLEKLLNYAYPDENIHIAGLEEERQELV